MLLNQRTRKADRDPPYTASNGGRTRRIVAVSVLVGGPPSGRMFRWTIRAGAPLPRAHLWPVCPT